jgi:hypothetical protein
MPTLNVDTFLGLLTKEFCQRGKSPRPETVSGSGKRVFTGNELKIEMNSGDIPLI